jgi:hypothetical protein
MKVGLLSVFSCFLLASCYANTNQSGGIQNVSINADTSVSDIQKDVKICDYLSDKYEEYLLEIKGVEDVNCYVEYDEDTEDYSITVILTVLEGYENVVDEIEPVLHNDFSTVDIQVNTK